MELANPVRVDTPGCDRVDGDSQRSDLARERLGPADDAGSDDVRKHEVLDRLAHRAGCDVHDPPASALLEIRQAQTRQANDGDEKESYGLFHPFGVECSRRCPGWPTGVVHEDVDTAIGLHRRLDQQLEVARNRDVAGDGGGADPFGLALEQLPAPREHHDVRSFLPERFRDAQAHPGGRPADDGRAACQPEIHAYLLFSTPTTSRTAEADARSIFFSSALRRSFTISSTPAAPSLTGTPM